MADPGLLETVRTPGDTKFSSLHTIKFIAGYQSQRSPFTAIDTRYGTTFFGGKPDVLLAGQNCEISNKLTLIRRPGVVPYGTPSIPPPLAFYTWQRPQPVTDPGTTATLITLVDTGSALYNYSPTAAGIYFNKSANARQTNVFNVVSTLYCGDGVDLFKITGPNLLIQSNTFTAGEWVTSNATLGTGQTDPLNGITATRIAWSTTGPTAFVSQALTLNYTPIANNTFTFSVWLKSSAGTPQITLEIEDQVPSVVASQTFTLSQTWVKYQVTGTCSNGAATSGTGSITVLITSPSATTAIYAYGAQLEVGGPATPTEITTIHPQGVSLWGIAAPTAAPAITIHQFFSIPGTMIGLSPVNGYRYAYSYFNSVTGQISTASPLTQVVGAGRVNVGFGVSVMGSGDPQVDQIIIWRTTDGGGILFFDQVVPNPGAGNSFFLQYDVNPDTLLNTAEFAPIGGINNPPPAGLVAMEFHAGRLWGKVGSLLYYASSNDNAAQLNIAFNGVGPECWSPTNVIPYDAPLTRLHTTPSGLFNFTTTDIWLVQGQDLTSFYPQKILKKHGLRSYNAVDFDGSTILAVLADGQFVEISPGTGSVELGFPIGDQISKLISPVNAYVSRHNGGSQDNAVFVSDGATGWFRLNPNQVGASMSGEVTPVWSPFAIVNSGSVSALTGGAITATASIETSPGVVQLLIGQAVTGPVLVRSLSAKEDNGAPFTWNATIGSVYLTPAGHIAEVESVTVESINTPTGDLSVGVLLDEISGTFESLPISENDPPQLIPSVTVDSNRYYLLQGSVAPLCKHMQIQLSGGANNDADEILTITIRGALVPEQT